MERWTERSSSELSFSSLSATYLVILQQRCSRFGSIWGDDAAGEGARDAAADGVSHGARSAPSGADGAIFAANALSEPLSFPLSLAGWMCGAQEELRKSENGRAFKRSAWFICFASDVRLNVNWEKSEAVAQLKHRPEAKKAADRTSGSTEESKKNVRRKKKRASKRELRVECRKLKKNGRTVLSDAYRVREGNSAAQSRDLSEREWGKMISNRRRATKNVNKLNKINYTSSYCEEKYLMQKINKTKPSVLVFSIWPFLCIVFPIFSPLGRSKQVEKSARTSFYAPRITSDGTRRRKSLRVFQRTRCGEQSNSAVFAEPFHSFGRGWLACRRKKSSA